MNGAIAVNLMRIDILAFGSRGDVQPYIALGLGLQNAGHRVRIVTLGGFENFVRAHGLDHLAIARSPKEIAATEEGQHWVKQRESVVGFLRGFTRLASTLIEDGLACYWRECQDTEAIVSSASGLILAVHVAQKMDIPLVRAQYEPSVPTRYDWNGRTSPGIAMRGAWESFVASTFRTLLWQGLRGPTNRSRRDQLGLPPLPIQEPFSALHRRRIPLLDGYSQAVVPRPPDWGPWIQVTGYWFLDTQSEWQPPPELVDFMTAGPAPVFVGFGSVPFPNPETTTDLVVGGLARARQRGVVVTGGSEMATGRLSDDVFGIDSVPYDWLLPRVCAAVHQGGAGVTGAALRAGLPSVVVPVFGDHPFWAKRVHDLGAGPRPIPAKQLSMEGLADAIVCATGDEEIRRRAARIGKQIGSEDGVARAVEVFARHVTNGGRA